MKTMILFSFALLMLMSCAKNDKNKLDKFVYDYEQVLNEGQVKSLDNLFKKHMKNTGNIIVLVTTESYGEADDITAYSNEYILINEIGKDNDHKNVLIVFSDKNSEVRITAGEGVKQIINSDISMMIIDSIMLPEFREEKNYEGLLLGSQKIIEHFKKSENKI